MTEFNREDLGQKYLDYLDLPEDQRGTTFNDFFDWVGIPEDQRNDFVTAAILKRAQEIIDMEDKETKQQEKMKDNPDNYPWYTIGGKVYYLVDSQVAYNRGFFILEDTKEIIRVTGIVMNVMPTCLKFERTGSYTTNENLYPIAKVTRGRS